MRNHRAALAAFIAVLLATFGLVFMQSTASGDEPVDCESPTITKIIEHPAVPAVTEEKLVKEAWTETIPGTPGQHYSWNGGNRGVNDPPTVVPPHADWQANSEDEPHDNGAGGGGATWFGTPGVGLHVMGNSPSNASWFYFVAGTEEQTIEHPAEYETVVITPEIPAWTEEVEVPNPDYPCETEEPTPTPTVTPTPTDDPEPTPTPTVTPTPTDDPEPTPTDDPTPTDEPEPTPTDDPTPTDEPEPTPTDDPTPDEPKNPNLPTPPTEIPSGEYRVEYDCVAGTLVIAHFNAQGEKTSTEYINGAKRCAPEDGETFKEEGM